MTHPWSGARRRILKSTRRLRWPSGWLSPILATLSLAIGSFGLAQSGGGANNQFGLWGSIEFRSSDYSAIHQWVGVVQRMREQQATLDACRADVTRCPSPETTVWLSTIERLRGTSAENQVSEVNRVINSIIQYREDTVLYGLTDYWATPLETLQRGGDCEDFAILKFAALLALGFNNDDMRIVVVHDADRQVDHAVLAVNMGDRTLILDNYGVPLPPRGRLGYRPDYSVNLTHRWTHFLTPELTQAFIAQSLQ